MVIINKDGSIFRLQGPNPIVAKQDLWDEKFIVHNLNYNETVFEQEKLEDIIPQEIKIPVDINKTIIYCLPAFTNEYHDKLYNEVKLTLTYGKKFSFEGIIAESNDMIIKIWTNLTNIDRNSILFVTDDRRWWKVEGKEEKANGFLLTCMPSSTQPSFD